MPWYGACLSTGRTSPFTFCISDFVNERESPDDTSVWVSGDTAPRTLNLGTDEDPPI
jgi:hypothetical protein